MAGDLLRQTERAATISLKADAGLAALVPAAQIEPVAEAPAWPFIRLDGTQAIPQGRGCTARSEVTFLVHSFAKPRRNGSGQMVETARDHAARINEAVVEALQAHAYEVEGRHYKFIVRSSRLMMDAGEADAWHAISSVLARVYNG